MVILGLGEMKVLYCVCLDDVCGAQIRTDLTCMFMGLLLGVRCSCTKLLVQVIMWPLFSTTVSLLVLQSVHMSTPLIQKIVWAFASELYGQHTQID